MCELLFTEEEQEKLSYIGASLCLERFECYLEETGNFDEALARAFPEVIENENIDCPSM